MPHLDEGVLQAWLDRPRSNMDESEADRVERHLEECEACAALLAELEGSTERTRSILASAGPPETAIPDFEAILGRGERNGTHGRTDHHRSSRRLDRWTSLAWAASLVLALGLGWMTNDLYRGDDQASGRQVAMAPAESQEAPGTLAEPEALPLSAAPGEPTVARPEVAGAQGPASGSAAEPAPALEPLALGPEVAEPTPAERRLADALPVPTPAPPSTAVLAQARSAAGAPPTATVRGRVVSLETGEPVASAQVFLPDRDFGVLSQQDGSFSLSVPVSSDSTEERSDLAVQRLGYREERRELALRPGDIVQVEFALAQSALQLDEVIVTGTPDGTQARAIGNSVTRLSGDDVPVRLPLVADSGWTLTSASTAAERLGFAPLVVPDLDVREIGLSQTGDTATVRVVQQAESGELLTLIERRSAEVLEDRVEADGSNSVSALVGNVLVTINGALEPDALRAMLKQLR